MNAHDPDAIVGSACTPAVALIEIELVPCPLRPRCCRQIWRARKATRRSNWEIRVKPCVLCVLMDQLCRAEQNQATGAAEI